MADLDMGGAPRREVSWAGKLLGLGIIGTAVIVVISGENAGSAAVTANALPILGGALACGIALPMALFRRTVTED